MKMTMKKLHVLFLAAMLLLTASCAGQGAAQPDPEPGDSQKEALQEIENSSAEPESEEDNADETTPAETEPDETEPEESEPAEQQMVEKNGDIVILYTSDVHCGVDQGFGYAGLQQIRDYLISKGNDVILVDNGDNTQGEPLGTMSRGEILVDLMNRMGYSIAIPGNHEFDEQAAAHS